MKRNNSYVNNVTTDCIAKICFQAGKKCFVFSSSRLSKLWSLFIQCYIYRVLILIEEFAVDMDSCLRCGKPTAPCLCPVTDVLRLKIY